MKASPNDSTSKAKKFENPCGWNARSATDLVFGLVQVLTYLQTTLAPILKILIFLLPIEVTFGDRNDILANFSVRNFQKISELACLHRNTV